ncbi:MAG: chromate transporter [Clostridiales Family XIII bacterium]|nr:chromate transporter [Clostridiales Family XIII bacterium]
MRKPKNHLELFLACAGVSALTLGGGYVIVPLMQKNFVERYGWFSEEEMLEIVALGQSAPGSIALNTANLVGWRTLGLSGAIAGVCGSILPPMAIILVVSMFYLRFRDNAVVAAALLGMTAGVSALIMDAVCTMLYKIIGARKILPILLCAGAFAAAFFFGANAVYILVFCAVFGVLVGARGGEGRL